MIITIGSFPGTETKELSKTLAMELGLKFTGDKEIKIALSKTKEEEMGEKIKEKLLTEAKKGNIVIEHPLAGIILVDAEAKIFLFSGKKLRARNLSEKENIKMEEAIELLDRKEREEAKNAFENFGSNIYDLKSYDLVMNIDKLTGNRESIIGVIKKYIEKTRK